MADITVAILKSELYLNISNSEFDTAIQTLINSVVDRAIYYISDEDITSLANIPRGLDHPLCKQITYEFRRRKDMGLKSVQYPDGKVEKYDTSEWLDSVSKALDKYAYINLGE